MRSAIARYAAVVLLVGALSGCGDSEQEAAADLDDLAGGVMRTGEDVVGALEGAGLEVAAAAGEGETCQMEPAPGLTFGFGARLGEQAAYDEQYDAALAALEGDGWEVTDAGEQSSAPWARLARDDYTLALDRTVREGSDALVLGLRRTDDCIGVPDGSVGVPEDLEQVTLVD